MSTASVRTGLSAVFGLCRHRWCARRRADRACRLGRVDTWPRVLPLPRLTACGLAETWSWSLKVIN